MKPVHILALLFLLSGCDIIEAPYYENPISQLPADEQCIAAAEAEEPFQQPITRKVLVEEMTGHKCGNCPEVGELIHDLKVNTFPGEMVVMSIHAGALSTPNSNGKYTTDFRTGAGNELYSSLNPFDVVPLGMINRDDKIAGGGAYKSKIESALSLPVEAGIRIFNCFDADSASLTSVIDVKYLIEGGTREHLAVYLVEDKVTDWQKDYRFSNPDLEGYTHYDVFRAPINGVWGEPLSSGTTIAPDSRFTKTYTFQLQEDWDPTNCKVIAFVFDNETKVVRQVEEAAVVN